jgi:multidrug resistance efflux pump
MTTVRRKSRFAMFVKPLALGALLLAATGTGIGFFLQYRQERTELRLPGTVETQEVRLSSRVGGRVSKVHVRESQTVEPGQPIVELAMPELDSQRAHLVAQRDAAEAVLRRLEKGPRDEEIAAARASVAAQQARVDRMRKGYRDEEKARALAEVESWQADLENARLELNRERALLDKGATTMAAYDAAVAKFNRLQALVGVASAGLQMKSGHEPEEVAESEAELARLQANLDLLLAGTRSEEKEEAQATIDGLTAQIDEIDVKRAERTITAPERAIVEILSVRPGDIVAPNQPVARVLRADDLWVKAYISEVELGRIKLGQKVQVTIDTFPGKRFEGEVTYIASAAEFTPRNVQTIDERRHQVFGFKVRVVDPQGVFNPAWPPTCICCRRR